MVSGICFGFSEARLQGLPFLHSHFIKPRVSSGDPEWPEVVGHPAPVP